MTSPEHTTECCPMREDEVVPVVCYIGQQTFSCTNGILPYRKREQFEITYAIFHHLFSLLLSANELRYHQKRKTCLRLTNEHCNCSLMLMDMSQFLQLHLVACTSHRIGVTHHNIRQVKGILSTGFEPAQWNSICRHLHKCLSVFVVVFCDLGVVCPVAFRGVFICGFSLFVTVGTCISFFRIYRFR